MEIFQCSLKAQLCRGQYSSFVYDLISVLLEEFPNLKPNAPNSLGKTRAIANFEQADVKLCLAKK